MAIEISCGLYKELVFIVADNVELNHHTLANIRAQAEVVFDECERRQGSGSVCTGNCPIPRMCLADAREIQAAVEEARRSKNLLKPRP